MIDIESFNKGLIITYLGQKIYWCQQSREMETFFDLKLRNCGNDPFLAATLEKATCQMLIFLYSVFRPFSLSELLAQLSYANR